MSDHLPECRKPAPFRAGCICDRLRASEQRVRENERQKIRTSYLTGIQVSEVNKAYVSGYSRALDAAREAVVGMNPAAYLHMLRVDAGQTLIFLADALAAIDALRSDGSITLRRVTEPSQH